MNKLNLQVQSGQVAHASTFNQVTSKVDEIVEGKQDKLVSGTNIVTLNGQSLLKSGNIEIKSGTILNLVALTLSEYNALTTKNENTLYLIKADSQDITE